MVFVPLLLLERAPGPDPAGGGREIPSAAASVVLDVVSDDRGPAPPVEPAVDGDGPAVDGPAVEGREATTAMSADELGAAPAAPPPAAVAPPTTTTTAPVVTTTTSTVVPLARVRLSTPGRQERGQASWYHAADRSCAHRTLPFGTMVTVTRVATDARATCRVSDRGPADTSRVFDLSYDTFALLADPGRGLVDVRLQW